MICIVFESVLFFLLGKYMQMMNVLKPIAFDVVICMSQLFDYYLYAVRIDLFAFKDPNSLFVVICTSLLNVILVVRVSKLQYFSVIS